jgi:signal transduction histidine kinase
MVSSSARRAFEAFDRQRTAVLMTLIRSEFSRQAGDVARAVDRIVASDSFQRTAVEIGRRSGDYAPFVNEAAPLAAAQGLDFLDLVADDSTLISSAEWPARFGYRHPWAGGRTTPDGAAFLQPIELPGETALGLVAIRRAAHSQRSLIVVGGRRLDQPFLKSLALPEGMRVLLYRNLEPELSRQQLIDAAGNVPQAAQLEPLIARVRQSGQEAVETVRWRDGPEMVDAIPLTGPGGAVLGVLLLGSSGREVASLLSQILWSGVAVGAGGVALGLVLGYVLASRVTKPVEQLAETSRQIAAGHWDVQTGAVEATGEIAALAKAFDAMTRQLIEQRERLLQAERVAAWRELARRLAHELKNPLFPLRLTLDNLRRARPLPGAEVDEVFDESLTALDTGLQNLNAVIARFSDFARMPAPEIRPVAPNAIVERALTLFRPQIEAAGRPPIRLALDLDPGSRNIEADEEQLGRALQNLLLNAIDAMPRGGQLGIRTRHDGSRFRIAVSDTGDGLTHEECKRLFTPYYTTKQHGTGLGLAIVQSVVADHGGKVWVESAVGRGTTFHIDLPQEPQTA